VRGWWASSRVCGVQAPGEGPGRTLRIHPRAESVTTNLARAGDELQVAAERLENLFAAGRSVTAPIKGMQR
jgi:hypothetical protein